PKRKRGDFKLTHCQFLRIPLRPPLRRSARPIGPGVIIISAPWLAVIVRIFRIFRKKARQVRVGVPALAGLTRSPAKAGTPTAQPTRTSRRRRNADLRPPRPKADATRSSIPYN